LLALPIEIPGLDKDSRKETRSYLEEFYAAIDTPRRVRRLFVDCSDRSAM